jgi:uncharacterized protein (TIGR02391 family)
VEQAAKSLVARVQQKTGSAQADRELMADVLSPKVSTDRVRLWLPGDRTDDTWKSRQDGLHLVAQGAYAGIRNVVAHTDETDWSEQEALEYLAVLSVVARWVDEAEPVTRAERRRSRTDIQSRLTYSPAPPGIVVANANSIREYAPNRPFLPG